MLLFLFWAHVCGVNAAPPLPRSFLLCTHFWAGSAVGCKHSLCVYSTRVVLSWSEEKTNRFFFEAASPNSKTQVSAGLFRAGGDRITATGERAEVRHRTVRRGTLIRDTAPKKTETVLLASVEELRIFNKLGRISSADDSFSRMMNDSRHLL